MKPKFLAVRPSELVILAIHNLGEKSGSSEKDIIRFISKKFVLDADHLAPRVEAALRRGLNFGILSFKNGRYSLEEVPEPMNEDFEGNMNDLRWNEETSDKDRRSRKRDRSEISGNISDNFGREMKKTKGYCSDDELKMDEPLYMSGNKNNLGESNPRSIAAPSLKPIRARPRKQSRKQRDGMRGRRQTTERSRNTRTRRKPVKRTQRKSKSKVRSVKSKGASQAPKNEFGGGALKNLAKIFGMARESKSVSKPKKKVKEPVNATQRKKNANNKHCSKACPKSCPNALRRTHLQSKENNKQVMKRNTEVTIGSRSARS